MKIVLMVLLVNGPLAGKELFRGRMASAEVCEEVAAYANAYPENVKQGRKYFCKEEADREQTKGKH